MSQHRNIVVIGAGIAGLSAAREAASAGASVLCIDKLGPGGVLINLGALHDVGGDLAGLTGPDLVAKLVDEATEAGVELGFAEVERLESSGPWTIVAGEESWTADAVILATGLAPGTTGMANESAYEGRGLSHCAACDGPLYAGQDVLVTGNGRWATQEAIELAGMVQRVTLLRDAEAAPSPGLDELAALPNASVWNGRIVGLEGSDGLEHVTVERGGTRETLNARGLFVYAGQRPATALVAGCAALQPTGHVAIDGEGRSSVSSLFAAGDLGSGAVESIAAATESGRRAGRSAAAALGR